MALALAALAPMQSRACLRPTTLVVKAELPCGYAARVTFSAEKVTKTALAPAVVF